MRTTQKQFWIMLADLAKTKKWVMQPNLSAIRHYRKRVGICPIVAVAQSLFPNDKKIQSLTCEGQQAAKAIGLRYAFAREIMWAADSIYGPYKLRTKLLEMLMGNKYHLLRHKH